ncbi:MAG: helix-turn-helix transcriptional regulator [Candidatus Baltobacteraceae bacterium]
MDLRRQVGLNVRQARSRKGWSQEELAFRSGLHRTYVSGVERGTRNPTVLVIGRLAATLGIAPAELLEPVSDTRRPRPRER